MCLDNQFCPDKGNECQNLIAVDGTCELNRDGQYWLMRRSEVLSDVGRKGVDECLPPRLDLQALLQNPSNFNGSLCLNLKCTYANATVANACSVDNTVYTGYSVAG